MKNLLRIALLTFTLLFSAYSFGNAINKDIAMQIANNFYLEMFADRINNIYDDFEIKLAEIRTSGGHDLLYIYNLHDEGFLILSAWDGTIPVLGFSTERAIELSAKDLPPGFAEIIKNYESEILYAINHNLEANSEISEQWKKWLNPSKALQDDSSVSPLLSTAWNQSCYYNALCPEDEASPNGYCGHVPAGCVALAMAQVMKYWNHPVSGSGSHSYSISPYGLQWADFENTTYQWENMPTNLGNSNTDVATLIYHCAVSVDMQFDPSGSGASTSLARNSLINYFGYNEEAQYFLKDNYQDSEWESMLRAELDIQRPVIYRGNGTGGHAWVCDGYAADNYFHMNWGWGGYANGYFYLSNLNPAGANFNNNQAAIMDIVPANASVEPPTNLQAQVSENDVLISWSAPQEPQWIHWDNGTNAGTISLDGGGSYYIAARWSTSDLELLDEAYISKVSFFLGSDAPGYVLKIWEGENTASLIYSQTLETITENSWNTVNLTNPLQIDASEELYIGLLIFGQPNGVTTIGYDSGPAVDGKGDFISFDGSNWNELQNLGFDFNWNIQAYVNFNVGNKTISLDDEIFEPLFNSINTTLKLKPNMQNFLVKVPDNRGLLGYNIYRDGQKLNENLLAETFYTDLDLPAGSYEYYVTSVYFAGESEPCGSVYATVTLLSHDFQLKAGWNSVSSNIVPMNPAVEFICNPIMEQFLFMKDMNNFYSPAYNHNGIENWDLTTGYLIKVGQDCQLPFQGFPNEAHTITLNNGWNLMPVLSDCEINTEDFFSDIQAYIRIVKDAAGTGVYWPSANINSLPVLEPGKAYYVKIFSTQSVTFPLCD